MLGCLFMFVAQQLSLAPHLLTILLTLVYCRKPPNSNKGVANTLYTTPSPCDLILLASNLFHLILEIKPNKNQNLNPNLKLSLAFWNNSGASNIVCRFATTINICPV